MRKKIGTILDGAILERARDRAAAEGRPLANLIEDALCRYLAESDSPVSRTFGVLTLSDKQLEEVLQADPFDA